MQDTQLSKDDYLIWRQLPVTKWILANLKIAAQLQKLEWDKQTWGQSLSGEVSQISPQEMRDKLLILKTRADAYSALEEADFESWVNLNG